MILHSPPKGHCDQNAVGTSLGSNAILDAIEAKQPRLAVFGHIHESWGSRSKVGETDLANLGPEGDVFELS
jgi:Icc-related predicted phosphoesterase